MNSNDYQLEKVKAPKSEPKVTKEYVDNAINELRLYFGEEILNLQLKITVTENEDGTVDITIPL